MPTRRIRYTRPMVVYGDPEAAAQAAGLRYIADEEPGCSRRRRGKGWSYHAEDGTLIKDAAQLERIKALAIPPAWQNVWICADPRGHIQATGYDARGRKQYRYHDRWRTARDAAKYGRMLLFGEALPAIRKQVAADLRKHGLPREKVLATVVRLLEETLIRVGNDEYARRNKTYGLTTMRDKHVTIHGRRIEFRFRGKSGVKHTVDLADPQLARIVKRCRDLPGYELFQYFDEDGQRQDVKSHDVNDYLKSMSDNDWTAKDFRTWNGTVLTLAALRQCEPCATKAAARRCVAQIIKDVADHLGNTPAVCRKSYVHPQVIDCFIDQSIFDHLADFSYRAARSKHALTVDEAALMHVLKAIHATVEG